MLGLYLERQSPVHHLHAGFKLAFLVLAGSGVFLVSNIALLAAGLGISLLLYLVARLSWLNAFQQIRPLLPLLAIIFIFQALFDHWSIGVIMVLRFLILILLASLLTLTTRVSAMIEIIEKSLQPFAGFGVNPAKVSLAISLAIRFLPLIAQKFEEVREAQKARGLGGSVVATAVPLIVRTLRMANDTAEALEARSYDATQSESQPERQSQPRQANKSHDGISPNP